MKLKNSTKLVAGAAVLAVGSCALADNIAVSDAEMWTDAYATMYDSEWNWDVGDASDNPFNSDVYANAWGNVSYASGCAGQDTSWNGTSIESAGGGHGSWQWYEDLDGGGENAAEASDSSTWWAADGQSYMSITFTALGNLDFELDVDFGSSMGWTDLGWETSHGYLYDLTTSTMIVDWSVWDGDASFVLTGVLDDSHEYELHAYALGGIVKDGLHEVSGSSGFDLSLTTSVVVPMPAAVFSGLVGLGGLGLSRGRRRHIEA